MPNHLLCDAAFICNSQTDSLIKAQFAIYVYFANVARSITLTINELTYLILGDTFEPGHCANEFVMCASFHGEAFIDCE